MNPTDAVIYKDEFAKYLGIEILEFGAGRAKTRMKIGAQHLNGLGMVHGGAIFTLADCAFAAACNSYGCVSVAINANISYVKASKTEYLLAEAEEVQQDGKLGTCSVRVTDDQGQVIATFQGLSYRKGSYQNPAAGSGA